MSAEADPRVHRVTLCAMEFFEVEVFASDRVEAFAIARTMREAARLKFSTVAEPCRAEILRMNDPRDTAAGMSWQEVRAGN